MGASLTRPGLESGLYLGTTTHTRLSPQKHKFSYSIYMAYLDLSELERGHLERWPIFSSRTRFAFLSLLHRDHMANSTRGKLSDQVRDVVAQATGTRPMGKIGLLTNLRVLGVEMNPVCFYYCFGEDGGVDWLVAEVSNFPWLEQHCYVIRPMQPGRDVRRFETCEKKFHVSPFIGMDDVRYEWLVGDIGKRAVVKIAVFERGSKFFSAGMVARRIEWGCGGLVWVLVGYPLYTVKVMMGILYEAGRLLRKGVRFLPHPHGSVGWLSWMVELVFGLVLTVVGAIRWVRRRRVGGRA